LVGNWTDETGTNGVAFSRRDQEADMSRYYFHLRFVGGQVIADQDGSDLPDAATAGQEALAAARQVLADAIRFGNENIPEAFVIVDCEGRELETVPFAAALPKRLTQNASAASFVSPASAPSDRVPFEHT